MNENFIIKDSGERKTFDSGMVRDTDEGKTLWHLVASGPMFRRWALHLTAGAKKYTADNWMKASGMAELLRFKASAFRHFMQWFFGDRDEDHAAAVFFNVNGAEYVKEKLDGATQQHSKQRSFDLGPIASLRAPAGYEDSKEVAEREEERSSSTWHKPIYHTGSISTAAGLQTLSEDFKTKQAGPGR